MKPAPEQLFKRAPPTFAARVGGALGLVVSKRPAVVSVTTGAAATPP